jgi:hypothetical protein
MLRIIEGEDLKCKVMKTDRGIHCYFKSVEPWKCFKKERLACGSIRIVSHIQNTLTPS